VARFIGRRYTARMNKSCSTHGETMIQDRPNTRSLTGTLFVLFFYCSLCTFSRHDSESVVE
jgi:hypothetical protein